MSPIKCSNISNPTKSYLFMYYNYIIITNIKKKLVNYNRTITETKITKIEKKNASVSSYFSLEEKLCAQVIHLTEVN